MGIGIAVHLRWVRRPSGPAAEACGERSVLGALETSWIWRLDDPAP